MAQETGITRVESFPFGSTADGYDSDGYPVYDRAVGAEILRATFEKFFTDGVFPTPGNALQISKGSGLNVIVAPGIFIIKGAMGGYGENGVTLTLDTAAPQGNTAYGIMLRYDQNRNVLGTGIDVGRSLSLRVVRGDAASTPQPPAPDQSTPGVYEYRLGYVTVPSGATDLSGATVTNEKGSSACPYAAPFEEVDVSSIMDDVREQASTNLNAFMEFLLQNIEFVQSALDQTTAGNLQSQIDQIKADMFSEANLNPSYLEATNSGVLDKKWVGLTEDSVGARELKNGAVETENLEDASVTGPKIASVASALIKRSANLVSSGTSAEGNEPADTGNISDLIHEYMMGTWDDVTLTVAGSRAFTGLNGNNGSFGYVNVDEPGWLPDWLSYGSGKIRIVKAGVYCFDGTGVKARMTAFRGTPNSAALEVLVGFSDGEDDVTAGIVGFEENVYNEVGPKNMAQDYGTALPSGNAVAPIGDTTCYFVPAGAQIAVRVGMSGGTSSTANLTITVSGSMRIRRVA